MHRALSHVTQFLIVLYLFVPVMGFAHVDASHGGITEIQAVGGVVGSPCDHCPCSDEQGSRCCDASSCSCGFHGPPTQGLQIHYAPVEIITRHAEPFRMLPLVYFPIFVPPQKTSLMS